MVPITRIRESSSEDCLPRPLPDFAIMEGLQSYVLHANRQAMDLLHVGRIEPAYRLLQDARRKAEIDTGLLAITLNNLGCYYKRVGKPMHALKQLYEALRLESLPPANATSIAGTHLNICAIRSQLGKHQSALAEALKALEVLSTPQEASSNTASTLAIAYYNAGVELEYLKRLVEAEEMFRSGWKVVKDDLGEEHPLVKSLLASLRGVTEARTSKHSRGRSLENTVSITLEPVATHFPPKRKKSKQATRPHTRIGFNQEPLRTRLLEKSDLSSLVDTLQTRLSSISPADRKPLYSHRERSLKVSRTRPKSRFDHTRPLLPAPPPRPSANPISTSQGLERKVDRMDTQLRTLQRQIQAFAAGRLSEPQIAQQSAGSSQTALPRKLSTPPPPKLVRLLRPGLGAVLKGYLLRKSVRRRIEAAVKLQTFTRKHQCSMLWRNIRQAVIFIQRVWRQQRRK